jgi:hypothetical protein
VCVCRGAGETQRRWSHRLGKLVEVDEARAAYNAVFTIPFNPLTSGRCP